MSREHPKMPDVLHENEVGAGMESHEVLHRAEENEPRIPNCISSSLRLREHLRKGDMLSSIPCNAAENNSNILKDESAITSHRQYNLDSCVARNSRLLRKVEATIELYVSEYIPPMQLTDEELKYLYDLEQETTSGVSQRPDSWFTLGWLGNAVKVFLDTAKRSFSEAIPGPVRQILAGQESLSRVLSMQQSLTSTFSQDIQRIISESAPSYATTAAESPILGLDVVEHIDRSDP